jgi:hypothetical protein
MPGDLVLSALHHLWTVIEDRQVKACLMGGMSLAHWGYARFTRDVDVLISIDPVSINDFVRALSAVGFAPRTAPFITQVGSHSFVQLMFTPKGRFDEIPVDLLIADSDFLRGAVERGFPSRLNNWECRVVSCEDLILLKLQADRLIDRLDVRYLLQHNRATLDLTYLADWIKQLGLGKEWADWWRDAFPDDPAPTA